MKKMLLTIISILIVFFCSILIYHIFSEDSIEVNQTDERYDTTEDVMNEIDESLLDEDDELDIGEMV